MYHVSAQGVDERMINVHYYYYSYRENIIPEKLFLKSLSRAFLRNVLQSKGEIVLVSK